jgi:prepilin-type N-terminal cleavage/methylation domain-containing protein
MARLKQPGFTLIEILLAVAALVILASIVILAINPSRQLAQTRNVQRRSNVNTILNAVGQYAIDNNGHFPEGIDTLPRLLGTASSGCQMACGTGSAVLDNSRGIFDSGSYGGTSWDNANNWLELAPGSAPFGVSGSYTSRVMDASSSVSWSKLSWTPQRPIDKELPGNGQSETAYPAGNANMNSNKLLLHLNELSGTLADSSGNGNDGTAHGGVTYGTAGKFNNALNFDGNDGYVEVDPRQNISGRFTVSAWVKLSEDMSGTIIGTRGPDGESSFDFKFCGDGSCIHGDIGDGTDWFTTAADAPFNYEVGVWYNIVYVVNQTGYTIYVNGQEAASNPMAYSGTPLLVDTTNNHHLYVGQVGYNNEFFNGQIDEVAAWDRELSAVEISDLYQRGALKLRFQVRSGSVNPPSGNFIGPDGTSGTYYSELSNSSPNLPSVGLANVPNNRYFQYRAYLDTDNNSFSPELKSVSLDAIGQTSDACLDLSGALVPGYVVGIPHDPGGDNGNTRYAVQKTLNGRLNVYACTPELGQSISVAR